MSKVIISSRLFSLLVAVAALVPSVSSADPIRPRPPRPVPDLCMYMPDLMLGALPRPQMNGEGTTIYAEVRNVGGQASGSFVVRLVDDGSPADEVTVEGLEPGERKMVRFDLPYWVFNPTVDYHVSVDADKEVRECSERNNARAYNPIH